MTRCAPQSADLAGRDSRNDASCSRSIFASEPQRTRIPAIPCPADARQSPASAMPGPNRQSPSIPEIRIRMSIVALWLVVALAAPGCAWMRWGHRDDPLAFSAKTPCRLPANPSVDDLVLAVNDNVSRLQRWRAGRVKLRANHMPLSLEADLAVEKGRHLRLVVRHALGGGDELDLGCNDDVFWYWARRQKPAAVMYASYDQLDSVRDQLQIPFEPDWLMEALGVSPIPTEGLTLEPIPGTRTARLVSHHRGASGRLIRKAITVDTCHGRVLEHSVWDSATGVRMAHAEFSNHRIDPASGVVMAHHIQLDWPQADLSLSMDLGHVEINPPALPERIWDMPHPPGCPVMNLEDFSEQRTPSAHRSRASASTAADQEEFWQPRRRTELDDEEPVDYDGEAP